MLRRLLSSESTSTKHKDLKFETTLWGPPSGYVGAVTRFALAAPRFSNTGAASCVVLNTDARQRPIRSHSPGLAGKFGAFVPLVINSWFLAEDGGDNTPIRYKPSNGPATASG